MELTHIDTAGNARMVDVGGKAITARRAVAAGQIRMSRECLRAVEAGAVKKGDVLGAARLAGIMAAKRAAELIPLCHGLNITSCEVALAPCGDAISATCSVGCDGKTGVEMEALTGVSIALLTIYDMCKAIDKRMVIENIHLVEKIGGKSGAFAFDGE